MDNNQRKIIAVSLTSFKDYNLPRLNNIISFTSLKWPISNNKKEPTSAKPPN